MDDIKLAIPRISKDTLEINLKKGDLLFIVGPNGSGKSALMQRFVTELPQDRVKRITAHRQTWFNSGSIVLTPQNRKDYEQQNRSYDRKYDSRWKEYNPAWEFILCLV